MRYPLVDGQGNFGSIDDDPPAAMRYTEARLSRIATEMLRDLDEDTVDFVPNYDGAHAASRSSCRRASRTCSSTASSGIAVGMATNIPPHNLREVDRRDDRLHRRPDDRRRRASCSTSRARTSRPAAIILGRQGIRDAYETGRGRVRVQARAHIEPLGQGKEAIIVTELPYQVKKGGDGGLIAKIAELVHDKKIPEISDMRDESDRDGMRARHRAQARRDPEGRAQQALQAHADADDVRRQHGRAGRRRAAHARRCARSSATTSTTSARSSSGARSTSCAEAEARAHILEGLLIALDNLDEVIALIRALAPTATSARDRPGRALRADARSRPQAILDLRLAPADRARGRQDQAAEHADIIERIAELRAILGDEQRVLGADQGGAARDRASASATSAAREITHVRGRDRHRGPDRRPADGHHDHEDRLHQVAAARHLPPAAAAAGAA